MNSEEARYVELMEEKRIADRAEAAAFGSDATVDHINQSKLLAPAIVKPVNPYRKPVLPGPYQLTMEEAIIRNEFDMQQ